MTWHDELMATCGAESLATGNISRRLAAVHEVLRSVALQTVMNGHSELELDALRNIKPMKLGVKEMCQAAVEQSRQWVTGSDPRPTDPHKK